jgi:hypothetical protein
MRLALVFLAAAACTSPPAGHHVAVAIDVEAANTQITVNGAVVDPGTAGPGHGVGVRDSVDDWSQDISYAVTATRGGAEIGTIVVPPRQCGALCPGDPCSLDDVNTEWTQIYVTADSIVQGCVRCVGSSGLDLANECPPPQ